MDFPVRRKQARATSLTSLSGPGNIYVVSLIAKRSRKLF
jgi:hypothetical protein